MFYHGDTELEDTTETTLDPKLVLDGTVNLDYSSDDEPPRVKGLIELINEYIPG
jgi:hypothetical protein